ncbi:MAG TPA: DUF190 domain-containing protein [Bacteroidales bacterium]|nr:DUF190 domain-containing protein [Bacteroidales bacterium]
MALLPEEGTLLRIFISEEAKHGRWLLYEAIVHKAQEAGLAGATVFRGIMGYQAGHEIHTSSLLRLSDNMPVVVEIVDDHKKIEAFLPTVKEMVTDGLITSEKARIIKSIKKT